MLLIEQHHADNSLKVIYKSIKNNLGLPFLNTDYRAFARWPSYFEMSWKSLLPSLLKKKYEVKCLDNFIYGNLFSLSELKKSENFLLNKIYTHLK